MVGDVVINQDASIFSQQRRCDASLLAFVCALIQAIPFLGGSRLAHPVFDEAVIDFFLGIPSETIMVTQIVERPAKICYLRGSNQQRPSLARMFSVAAGLDEWSAEERAWLTQHPKWMNYEVRLRDAIRAGSDNLAGDGDMVIGPSDPRNPSHSPGEDFS